MKNILIIYTGGTIGMHRNHATGALMPYSFQNLLKQLPELKKINCKLEYYPFKKPIDSSDVQPEFWDELGDVINKAYHKHDGFVILHGTDTMAYTACALSYMLSGLKKPVVLTGSQLPLGEIRSDARRNLIASVEIVAAETKLSEVSIFFNNQLFRGNRSEKYSSSKFDAFHSLNYPALGETGVQINFFEDAFLSPTKKTFKCLRGFDKNVFLIKLFPGMSVNILQHLLAEPQLKAVVIETYGSGNAPTDKRFIQTLSNAIEAGIVVVNVSQCSGGKVVQGKYATSLALKKAGIISGGDMTTEAAVTKLMHLFGQNHSAQQVARAFSKSIAGEITA